MVDDSKRQALLPMVTEIVSAHLSNNTVRQVVAASDAAAIARLAGDPARRFDLPPDPQYLRPPDISQPKIRS